MKVGPRLVIVVLVVAIGMGVKDNLWKSFYETFLALNGVNWLLKLVSKEKEKEIMDRIRKIERGVAMSAYAGGQCCWDTVKVTIQCLRPGGGTYPPVLDV